MYILIFNNVRFWLWHKVDTKTVNFWDCIIYLHLQFVFLQLN